MKIIQTIFTVSLIILLFVSASNAQSLKIGVGGGVTQLLSPSAVTNKVSEGGLGFTTEWNIGAMGKLDLPIIPITPRAFLLYHMFSGNGTDALSQDIENSQSIFEYGVGAQYNFIPVPLGFNPYVALDLSFSNFGDFTQKVDGVENKTSGVTRFGGGIGLGSEVTLVPLVNLDVYLCYKIFNLTGKDEGEDTISAATLDVFVNFNL